MFESFKWFKSFSNKKNQENIGKLAFEPRSCLLFYLMGKSTPVSSHVGNTLVASESGLTHEIFSKDEQTAQDDASECVVSFSNNTVGIRASGQRSAEEQSIICHVWRID